MLKAELAKYKALLEARRSQLAQNLRDRKAIAIEKSPDLVEETQLAADRELAIRNLNRESGLLRQVEQALARMTEGAYGLCLNCGEEIKPRRLEAVPWAAFCVPCQEAVDQGMVETEEFASSEPAEAA
jgi:DnaK suppressor protein